MNYKQNNLTTPLFIVVVMIVASLSPLALASSDIDAETSEFSYGSLDDFDPSIEGKKYMFTNETKPAFSATGHLKKQWIEDGYPNLVLPFSQTYMNSKSSARNCTDAWSQGDTDTVPSANGNVDATVQKISSKAAIFVEDGQI